MERYLLHEGDKADQIKPEHAKKYKSLCRQMQKLLDDIAIYAPDVNLYLEDDSNWNLMIGPTHEVSRDCFPLQGNVALVCTVRPSGGGGW